MPQQARLILCKVLHRNNLNTAQVPHPPVEPYANPLPIKSATGFRTGRFCLVATYLTFS